VFCRSAVAELQLRAETIMKIYLLIMLMSALFAAIRFTTAQDQQSNSVPQ
jgi:hypothetical protein